MSPYLLLNSLSNDTYFVGVRFTIQTLSVVGGSHRRLLFFKIVWYFTLAIKNFSAPKKLSLGGGGGGTGMAIFLFWNTTKSLFITRAADYQLWGFSP